MGKSYSRIQIALHWVTVLAVLAAWLGHDQMEEAWRAISRGGAAEATPYLHIAAGLTVLALTLIRIAVRLRQGAPELPADMAAPLKLASKASHLGLYFFLVMMPVSGFSAWFLGLTPPAEVHGTFFAIFAILIGIHVAAALWHQFVRRDGLMGRMWRTG